MFMRDTSISTILTNQTHSLSIAQERQHKTEQQQQQNTQYYLQLDIFVVVHSFTISQSFMFKISYRIFTV